MDIILGYTDLDTITECRLVSRQWMEVATPVFTKKLENFDLKLYAGMILYFYQ